MRNQPLRSILVGLLLLATAGAALAGDRGPLDQDIQVSLGGFFMNSNTDVRVDGEAQTGSDVNFEDDFGLGDADRFRLDAFWRFAEKHKIRAVYFENNRSADRTLTRDVNFGDNTYTIDTEVSAEFDERIIELAYEYAFYRTDTLEISGSAGIHTLKFAASLSGQVSGGGGGGSAATSDAEATGPLPVLGFRVFWDMGHNFYLDGMAQFFYIQFNQFDGRLYDYKLGATWFPWRNVGFGVGYNEFVTRVDISKDAFEGRLRLRYGGAMAFVTVGF